MSDHKYVTMENVLEADDWGLIINENGDLKGLYIPSGKDDSEVPVAIQTICEKYFGVNWMHEDVFDERITLH